LACWQQKTQHFHSCVIAGFEHGVNEMCAFWGDFTQNGSFLPAFWENSQWWWNSHSGVGEDSSHLGRFALSIYLHLQGQQPQMKVLCSTKTPVTLHQSPSTPASERHVSHNRTPCRAELRSMTRLYGSLKIIAAFTKAPHWTYFSFRALWYIKALVNTNKCTILQSVYSFYHL
jgi:hypothetical protein